jgi:Protein of unknown function (DUF3489)
LRLFWQRVPSHERRIEHRQSGAEPAEQRRYQTRRPGWQTHSVRGIISGQLKKKLGLKIRSAKREGKRVYSIKP